MFSRRALLFLLSLPFFSEAQFYSLPTSYDYNILTTRHLARRDIVVHPAMQPFIPLLNQGHHYVADTSVVFRYIKEDAALDIIFREHFIQVKPRSEPFLLRIDPVFNFEAGRDTRDTTGRNLYTNTRGFVASGTIGRRFYFESMLCENQALFPAYLTTESLVTKVVPGQGRWKQFKGAGFDFAFVSGIASIQLWRNVNLQLGHGKHKIGHGYRSLLLSDNAFNYPFVRLTQQWLKGKLRYTNVYASFMNLVPAAKVTTKNTEPLFQKKSAAFQYLELQLHPAFSLSFFQGLVWKPGDERNRQHLTWEYFSPVIYSQLAKSGLDDEEKNIVAGMDILLKLSRYINVYGQLMADKNDDGLGYQAGIKYFDVFGIEHLSMQAEYNRVDEGAYTGTATPSYFHYNQNIAFTPQNCSEQIYMLDYRIKRLVFNARYHVQDFYSGARNSNGITNVKLGYVVNPRYNMQLGTGYIGRRNNYIIGVPNPYTDYFYVSFKTSIYNQYYDF